jgi:N-acetylglucosamine-6-phosphate deacetylase
MSAILAQSLFDGERIRRAAHLVHIEDGVIRLVEPASGRSLPADVIALPDDAILAPGLIDIQVNGGGGVLLNDDPSAEAIRRIVAAHRRFGTTGLLPTLITDSPDKLARLAAIADAALAIPGVLGFHLEGPFISPARKGIHPQAYIRTPTSADVEVLCGFGSYGRSLVTLAPECVDDGFIHVLAEAGLRVAAGHSDAHAPDLRAAAEAGLTGVTHLFNAMSQMTAREPGLVGATLDDERLCAGLICDGRHVDPMSLRVAFKAKGPDRLMLVTDAMPTVGGASDRFVLSGQPIVLEDGRLTGPDGTLAGAHLDMIGAVRNAVRLMSVRLEDALVMASRTPAGFLGLGDRLGRIAGGYRADLVAFALADFRVVETWVGGVPSA